MTIPGSQLLFHSLKIFCPGLAEPLFSIHTELDARFRTVGRAPFWAVTIIMCEQRHDTTAPSERTSDQSALSQSGLQIYPPNICDNYRLCFMSHISILSIT